MMQKTNRGTVDLTGVSARLKALREVAKLNSGDFARSVGIDPSSYSKIESGQKPLNLDMGFRVAEKWGVSLDFLYRGLLRGLDEDIATALRRIENGEQP